MLSDEPRDEIIDFALPACNSHAPLLAKIKRKSKSEVKTNLLAMILQEMHPCGQHPDRVASKTGESPSPARIFPQRAGT